MLLSRATQIQGHFSFSYCSAKEGSEGAQGAGWDRTRAADLNWPKGKKKLEKQWGADWACSHCLGTGWASAGRCGEELLAHLRSTARIMRLWVIQSNSPGGENSLLPPASEILGFPRKN